MWYPADSSLYWTPLSFWGSPIHSIASTTKCGLMTPIPSFANYILSIYHVPNSAFGEVMFNCGEGTGVQKINKQKPRTFQKVRVTKKQ